MAAVSGGAASRRKGDTYERATANWLRARGFYVARSAGSLGVADLVAMRSDCPPMLLSCKVSGRIDPGEWAELFDTAADAGAFAVVTWPVRRGTPSFGYLLSREKDRQRLRPLTWLNEAPLPRVGKYANGQ